MGLDKRIGPDFLNAGIGYGGSCFPKDVEALYRTSNENFYDFRLLRGVMDANEMQRNYFLNKIPQLLIDFQKIHLRQLVVLKRNILMHYKRL